MRLFINITIGCITIMGCPTYDPPKDAISVQNYSPNTIYIYQTCWDRMDSIPIRKLFIVDTIDGVEEISSPPYRIPPYEYKKILAINWQEKINSCPDSTLKIFAISEQTMKTKSWEEIWKNQLFFQKVEFKYKDVVKNYEVIIIKDKNNTF